MISGMLDKVKTKLAPGLDGPDDAGQPNRTRTRAKRMREFLNNGKSSRKLLKVDAAP